MIHCSLNSPGRCLKIIDTLRPSPILTLVARLILAGSQTMRVSQPWALHGSARSALEASRENI